MVTKPQKSYLFAMLADSRGWYSSTRQKLLFPFLVPSEVILQTVKNHLLAASPLEDSAGTAMPALLQSSSPLRWTSFREKWKGLPQADFICPTTSFGLRILKLGGKIPDIQSKNKLTVHVCPLADKVLLAKTLMQPSWHRRTWSQIQKADLS